MIHGIRSGIATSSAMNQKGARASIPNVVAGPGICPGGAGRLISGAAAIAIATPHTAAQIRKIKCRPAPPPTAPSTPRPNSPRAMASGRR